MKFLQSMLGLGMLAAATAAALGSPDVESRAAAQTVHLTFHGGPAFYDLTLKADGTKHKTNKDIAVNIIDANDYNAYLQCTFYTKGDKTLVPSIGPGDTQHVVVGPPQPITAVSCQGMCVPIYGECYDIHGQFVGPCCNGFCAATRCRPWNISTS